MKHVVYINDVHVSSYANLVLLQRLYAQIENAHWMQQRKTFLDKEFKVAGKLQCQYCGRDNLKLKSSNRHEQATVDHVVPKSLGGDPFSHHNFVVCCNNCNQTKAAMPVEEFINSKYIKNKKKWKAQ